MAGWPLFYYNMFYIHLYTMKHITAKWKKERPTTDAKIFNQLSFQFMASLPNHFFFFFFAFCFSAHYIIIVLLHTLYSHLPSFDLVRTVKISLMLGIKLFLRKFLTGNLFTLNTLSCGNSQHRCLEVDT